MTPFLHTGIPTKEILSQKKVFFLLICLHLHLIDHVGKQTFVGKNFLHSFIYLNIFFSIFHFKHVLREVGRKVLKCVNYTKCLVALLQDIVPNAQNRALKKWKLDSNPRYGPAHVNVQAIKRNFM